MCKFRKAHMSAFFKPSCRLNLNSFRFEYSIKRSHFTFHDQSIKMPNINMRAFSSGLLSLLTNERYVVKSTEFRENLMWCEFLIYSRLILHLERLLSVAVEVSLFVNNFCSRQTYLLEDIDSWLKKSLKSKTDFKPAHLLPVLLHVRFVPIIAAT